MMASVSYHRRNTYKLKFFGLTDNFQDGEEFLSGFDDEEIRKSFVVKVYALLSIQLFLTFGIIMTIIFVEKVQVHLLFDFIVMIVSLILASIIYFVLVCYNCARRNVPLNYILLTFMSICYGFGLGAMSTRYSTYIVATTIGVTAMIVLVLTIIAGIPCFDVTGYGLYLCLAGLITSLMGTLYFICGYLLLMSIQFLIYAGIIIILFLFYIVYDTQMILGGQRYELDPEEYVFGCVSLYVDIMYIFINLLQILGWSGN